MNNLLLKDYKKRFLQTKNCNLAVYSKDERSGYAKLFCLHGGPGLGMASLLPGILSLEDQFDLVLIDLRGESTSDVPTDARYEIDDYVSDVMEIKMAYYTSEVCGIFGHSFGGFIAIKALGHSENEFSFGILSNTAINNSWEETANKSVSSLANAQEARDLAKKFGSRPSDSLYGELCLNYSPLYFPELTTEASKEIMDSWSYRSAPYYYAMEKVFSTMELSPQATKIEVPCLIVGSTNDLIVPWECQEKLAEKISCSTLAKVNGAGHFPFITKSKDFFKIVHDWWTKTKEVK